jgi:hypothetical protein
LRQGAGNPGEIPAQVTKVCPGSFGLLYYGISAQKQEVRQDGVFVCEENMSGDDEE